MASPSGSSPDPTSEKSPFPPPARHITTHDPATRLAIFSASLPDTVTPVYGPGTVLHDAFATFSHPVEVADEVDISAFKAHIDPTSTIEKPGVWFPGVGETLVRYW